MADLLIKGMEMPTNCFNCSTKINPDERRCNYDGHIFEETLSKITTRRDENCPLGEVPTHGRLIDADATLEAMNTWDKFGFSHTGAFVREPNDDFVPYVHYEDMVRCVQNMTTVIEASEGGEHGEQVV